jgi:hypothetical protein
MSFVKELVLLPVLATASYYYLRDESFTTLPQTYPMPGVKHLVITNNDGGIAHAHGVPE